MTERWQGITLDTAKALLSQYADEIKRLQEENKVLRNDCFSMAAEIRSSTPPPPTPPEPPSKGRILWTHSV